MKKTIIISLLFLGVFAQMNAQEAEKFRFDIRLGYAGGDAGDGILLSIEPKWTINEQMIVGFRASGAALVDNFSSRFDDIILSQDRLTSAASYAGTFDYYYAHKEGSPFAAFVGGGLGLYSTLSVVGDIDDDTLTDNIDIDNGLGGFVRVGFDYFKFRLALEYNLVPKGDLKSFSNNVIGESKNNYVGLSLGFYFGGGKWKRSGAETE